MIDNLGNFNRVRIVLVEPTHPGNIGATARAMKTMGFNDLSVVNPKCALDESAYARASGAGDILDNADLVDSIADGLKGCQLVMGTSARRRDLTQPILTARESAIKAREYAFDNHVALVFGREHAGLTNDELAYCHFQVIIPSNPDYSSLNLAAAVQICCYELRQALSEPVATPHAEVLADASDVNAFHSHLKQVLLDTEFINEKRHRKILLKIRRLFNRAMLLPSEVNILRGMLTAVSKTLASERDIHAE